MLGASDSEQPGQRDVGRLPKEEIEQSWGWGLRTKDLLLEHCGRISSSLRPNLSLPNSEMGAGISEQGNGGKSG